MSGEPESLTRESLSSIEPQGTTMVPCFVCGNELQAIHADAPLQPYDGVICETSGNYGSRLLDSGLTLDGKLIFLVCDRCLRTRSRRVRRAVVERVLPKTRYESWQPLLPPERSA